MSEPEILNQAWVQAKRYQDELHELHMKLARLVGYYERDGAIPVGKVAELVPGLEQPGGES